MNLQDQYEKETGLYCRVLGGCATRFNDEYVEWLEDQLTWKPPEEKPEIGEEVLIRCEGEDEKKYIHMIGTGFLGPLRWIAPIDDDFEPEQIKVLEWVRIPKRRDET